MILNGRFSGREVPTNWIAADIVRIVDGQLIEHWDVLQDETTREQSKSGLPMCGDKFPFVIELCADLRYSAVGKARGAI